MMSRAVSKERKSWQECPEALAKRSSRFRQITCQDNEDQDWFFVLAMCAISHVHGVRKFFNAKGQLYVSSTSEKQSLISSM